MTKFVKIPLNELLSLIVCAEDCKLNIPLLMSGIAEWLDFNLSDEDIETYCNDFLTEESKKAGYTQKDYDYAKNKLVAWRLQYCTKEAR